MEANNFPHPACALVISAHPDDPDFAAAGTVACWAQAGSKIVYLIVTDGSKGSEDPGMTSEQLVALRQEEQRAAAEVLGVSEVVFLGYPDGEVYNSPELRRDIVRQIRLHRPDLVITHDPTARIVGDAYFNHTDHRAVGDAALDAIFPLARDRLNYPEHEAQGLEAHKVLEVFLAFSNQPNYWVDISATMDLKVKALKAHSSQFNDLEELEERLRTRARELAAKVSFEYAEVFRRVRLAR